MADKISVPDDLWDDVLDFIVDRVDIKDGADGPVPNEAMSLLNRIEQEVPTSAERGPV